MAMVELESIGLKGGGWLTLYVLHCAGRYRCIQPRIPPAILDSINHNVVQCGCCLTIVNTNRTLILVLQFLIGDTIVWGRVCAIWQNKIVRCVGFLLITFSTGMS